MNTRLTLILVLATLVISCSGEDSGTGGGEHVWKDQTDAMEKAKAVEGILEESSRDLRQHIQDETE